MFPQVLKLAGMERATCLIIPFVLAEEYGIAQTAPYVTIGAARTFEKVNAFLVYYPSEFVRLLVFVVPQNYP